MTAYTVKSEAMLKLGIPKKLANLSRMSLKRVNCRVKVMLE